MNYILKLKDITINDLKLYKKHIEKFFEYHDYMCADTNDGNINLLSLDAAHQTKSHTNMTLDEFKKIYAHTQEEYNIALYNNVLNTNYII